MEWKEFYKRLSEYKNSVRNHERNPSFDSMERYKQAYIGMKDAFGSMNTRADQPASVEERLPGKVLELIGQYGGIDGGHHKQWLLDQIVKILTGDNYKDWVGEYEDGEDGPQTYSWDTGIAP